MGSKEWIGPQERQFFDDVEAQSKVVVEGAEALADLLAHFEDVAAKRRRIKDLEHRGDDTVHRIYEELNKTFITPIDREDITGLASALDNVLDMIDASANRLVLYRIEAPTTAMTGMAEIILTASRELNRGVGMIRDMANADEIDRISVEVNRLENAADDLMNQSVADLFRDSDPVTIIKFKEIYERLEEATDYCEDAANVLSDIVAKNR